MRRIALCLIAVLFCAVPCLAQPYLDSFDFHIISPAGGETYHLGDTVNIVCTAPDPATIVVPPEAKNSRIKSVSWRERTVYEYFPRRNRTLATWIFVPAGIADDITTDTMIVPVFHLMADSLVTQCDSIGNCSMYSRIRDTAKFAIKVRYDIWIDSCTDTKDTIVCRPECDPNGCWPVCDTFPVQHCGTYYSESKTFYDTTNVFSIAAPASVKRPYYAVAAHQKVGRGNVATYNILGQRRTSPAGVCIGTKGLTIFAR